MKPNDENAVPCPCCGKLVHKNNDLQKDGKAWCWNCYYGECKHGKHPLIERLAMLEHEQWMNWSKTLQMKEKLSDECVTRWVKLWIPYSKLPDDIKEQDRTYAYEVLDKAVIPFMIKLLMQRRNQILKHRDKCSSWQSASGALLVHPKPCAKCMVGAISGFIDPLIADLNILRGRK